MGAAENRAKAQAHAEFMKRHGVVRRTGQCPMGCGATYSVSPTGQGNGMSLIAHLGRCVGGAAAKRLRAGSGRRVRRS